MEIQSFHYDGMGLNRVYENQEWTVALKNWKPENDRSGLACLERHRQSDELFILLDGECILLSAATADGPLTILPMEPMRVYCIPKGLWHNTLTRPGVKLALIEDVRTGAANSDTTPFTPEQQKALAGLAYPAADAACVVR